MAETKLTWLAAGALGIAVLLHEPPVRADERRASSITITSFCLALGTAPAAVYFGFDEPAARPLWAFHAGITPSIPRAVVQDWVGAALFSSARFGSILLAERWRNVETSHGTGPSGEFYVFGFALPLVAAVHRSRDSSAMASAEPQLGEPRRRRSRSIPCGSRPRNSTCTSRHTSSTRARPRPPRPRTLGSGNCR